MIIFAAGCATPPPRNDQERWFCERTLDGRDWICNQQRKRYSVPAAQGAATERVSPAGAAAPRQVAGEIETGAAIIADDRSGAAGAAEEARLQPVSVRDSTARWNAALPALSAGIENVPSASESEVTVKEQRKPPPEPEPVLARWEKAAADTKAVSALGSEIRDQVPKPETALAMPAAPVKRQPVPSVSSVSAPGRPGINDRRTYTVQIGAFKSERAARAYIAQYNLGELPTSILQQTGQGSRGYVLVTFGRFDSVKAARTAWRGSGAPSDLEIWIRPTSAAWRALTEVVPAAD